jgi:hypothetical protein
VVHVIGFPVHNIQKDGHGNISTVSRSAFGTNILEQTEACLKFTYPREGVTLNGDNTDWVKVPFIESPEGFSGAANEIYWEWPAPVILMSAYHDAELIARAEADHILAYWLSRSSTFRT